MNLLMEKWRLPWPISDDPQRQYEEYQSDMETAKSIMEILPQESRRKFPSFMAMAANFYMSFGKVVSSVANGEPVFVSNEEKDRRLSICHVCEHLKDGRCVLCGCVMRWKARISTDHCPDDPQRW